MKLAISILTIFALCTVASAGKKERAEDLWKSGKRLMAEKRYADACVAFEESFKLDPVIGTQLNLGKCYEEWGKLGRAFTSYQLAEKMARDTNDKRAADIKALVTELDPQVPRLTLKVAKNAPKDFKVTMDKKPVTVLNEAFVVDPGPKTIEWWVGKGAKKQKIIAIERGGESEVRLEIPKGAALEKPDGGDGGDGGGDDGAGDRTPAVTKKPAPGRNQRIGGIALAGAGVLAIGVSSIMTLSARGKYNDALDMYCNGRKNACDPMGLQATQDARSTANTATVIFIVGLAAVGGGVALYMLAPTGAAQEEPEEEQEASRYILPTVTPDGSGAGLVFGGSY